MIDFTKIEYVLAFWFVSWKAGNWLCFVYREKGASDWTMTYRWRYYADGKAFDSDDRKSWYEGKSDPSKVSAEQLLEAVDVIANLNVEHFQGDLDRVEVRGDTKKATRLLAERHWAHMKAEPIP